MKIEELKKYKRILILGYGREGKATYAFIKEKIPMAEIGIADKKDNSDYLEKQIDYDLVIKTPGIRKELITRPYTTATNIFFANVRGKTIGITGSKGKSTTASLIYQILKKAKYKVHLVGNIGNPMLAGLLASNQNDDFFVVELSSFQLDDIKFSPDIAVLLNLFQGHMDFHGDIQTYWQAKKRMVEYSRKENFYVFNEKYVELSELRKNTKARPVPFIMRLPVAAKDVPLIGAHNLDNVRATYTVARLLKIDDNIISGVIRRFKTLPHRLEFIGEYKGIKFYDDAISTTPESTIGAILSFKNIGTLFLGGLDRGFDFIPLVHTIIKYKVKNIVLFPDTGHKILKELKSQVSTIPGIFETKSMEEAVRWAYKNTPKQTVCLLSTAAPSFSLWKDFKEKGREFRKFVKKYGKE